MITKRDVVYVAGPMTGLPGHNYPAFFRMERKLKSRFKCKVLNPARNFGGDRTRRRAEYIETDVLSILLKRATAIVFLDGWTKSRGAQLEYFLGDNLGLRFYDRTFHPLNKFLWSVLLPIQMFLGAIQSLLKPKHE